LKERVKRERKEKRKNTEPKKLTRRDCVLTNSELNKHLDRKRNKKNNPRLNHNEVSV
jgi:hypothetical protein